MDIPFDNVSSLIIFTILFLMGYAVLLNIYFIHKNGFHVGVNCWFCNKNSKVLYSKRNSFECPFCFQYNGFKKDGGYNKVIDAQYNSSLNTWRVTTLNQKTVHSTPKSSNGLCSPCNKNQELKVRQLAIYEPLDNKNYDKEIEHFERQLEKTYQLCKSCSKIVRNTVRKQNVWIFGNRIKDLKSPRKSSKVTQGYQGKNSFYSRISVIQIMLLLLSVFNLLFVCGFGMYLPKTFLQAVLPPGNAILESMRATIPNSIVKKLGHKTFIEHFLKIMKVQEPSVLVISVLGFFIELLAVQFRRNSKLMSIVNKLISWIIVGLVSSFHFRHNIYLYFRTLEIFCTLYLTYAYSTTVIQPTYKQTQKFQLKRVKRDFKNDGLSDIDDSDSDSLNDTRVSYKTAVNKYSPITASSSSKLNRSFGSVRSRKSMFNKTLSDQIHTAKNVELNKHFNELNIGAFDLNLSNHRPLSPNPFLNLNTRPQSPASLYNYGSNYTISNGSFLNQSQHKTATSIPQSPRLNSSLSNGANPYFTANQTTHFLNQARPSSPMSVRTEPMSLQNQPLRTSSYNQRLNSIQQPSEFLSRNYSFNAFSPRDTSSVVPQNFTDSKSPHPSNLSSPLPTIRQTTNNFSQPLSPVGLLERPTRSLLSPPKLNNINAFHSDGKRNESFAMSFHTDSAPNTSMWTTLNNPQLQQRFVVSCIPEVQCNSPLNSNFVSEQTENCKLNNSRSSSASSGFVSNGEFIKGLSKSLPSSRNNSPERTLFPEPAYG